jgi:hypothetical protein
MKPSGFNELFILFEDAGGLGIDAPNERILKFPLSEPEAIEDNDLRRCDQSHEQ